MDATDKTTSPIDVVFFDIGSTLLYNNPSVPEMFSIVARERGHEISLPEVLRYQNNIDAYYAREYHRDGDFWCSHERTVDMWKGMYRYLAECVGLADDAYGISDEVHERYRDPASWALYDDTMPTLRALTERGYRLGTISNWDADLESIMEGVGILPYFDDVVASSIVGYRKPNPEIFELALYRMGVDGAHAVHVGDLPEADGACVRAGITPIIIDRDDLHADCDFIRIDTLETLPNLLEEFS